MQDENIWEILDLSEDKSKTAYDYLTEQADNLSAATKSVLTMEVEASHEISADEKKRELIIYTLFVKAPHLGNFRKKILHVAEFPDTGKFPVNIWNYITNSGVRAVEEANFLTAIKGELAKPFVKSSIENLYRQSLEAQKNSPN